MEDLMKGFVRRPSPAMLVAIAALIVALGGTAVAGGVLNKKKVNTIITNRAPGLSVSHAKSADSAGTAATAATAATASTATNVGGRTVDAAVVSANAGGASVVRGTATGASRSNTGIYIVSFSHDIRGCTYVATNGHVAAGSGPNGEISVEQRSSSVPTDVEVRHYNSAGSPADYGSSEGFHLVVVC
jgi:hypothetical protein